MILQVSFPVKDVLQPVNETLEESININNGLVETTQIQKICMNAFPIGILRLERFSRV